jgi:trans-aconitate methyltransferase
MLSALYILVVAVVLLLGISVLAFQGVTGVPPMSSSSIEGADIVELLRHAGIPERAMIYELGCGWGALVVALARAFPHAQIRGVELSPLPYWVSRLRTRNLPNVHLHRGNFYDCDVQNAGAVTCYLYTKPMTKLAEFLDIKLKPGTPVVSLSFSFRDRTVSAVRQAAGPLGHAALYYWPARKTNVQSPTHPF